jgi:hypothetical protein
MRFPFLLHANPTVNARVDKAFTMPANHAAILGWQPEFGSHSDFSSNLSIALSQLRFISNLLFSQVKKPMYSLYCDLSGFIHYLCFSFQSLPYLHQPFIE